MEHVALGKAILSMKVPNPNILELQLLCKPLCTLLRSIKAIPPNSMRLALGESLVLSPPVQWLGYAHIA